MEVYDKNELTQSKIDEGFVKAIVVDLGRKVLVDELTSAYTNEEGFEMDGKMYLVGEIHKAYNTVLFGLREASE